MEDLEEDPRRGGIGPRRLLLRALVLGDGDRAGGCLRVIDVEPSVRPIVGVESEAEKAAFAVPFCEVGDIEERFAIDLSASKDPDGPRLLDDEQSLRAVTRVYDAHR